MPILDDFTISPILKWVSLRGDSTTEAKWAEMRDLVEAMYRLNPSGRVHCDPNDPGMGGALSRHSLDPRLEDADLPTFLKVASMEALNAPHTQKVRLNPGPHTITLTFHPMNPLLDK